MATYAPECERQIEIARRMVLKDHKQRWVFRAFNGAWHISEVAVPYRDAVSVYWMPIVRAVAYNWRPRVLANPAIGAT